MDLDEVNRNQERAHMLMLPINWSYHFQREFGACFRSSFCSSPALFRAFRTGDPGMLQVNGGILWIDGKDAVGPRQAVSSSFDGVDQGQKQFCYYPGCSHFTERYFRSITV